MKLINIKPQSSRDLGVSLSGHPNGLVRVKLGTGNGSKTATNNHIPQRTASVAILQMYTWHGIKN